jgi:hypothetical protein
MHPSPGQDFERDRDRGMHAPGRTLRALLRTPAIQQLFRALFPFWLFQDASRGDTYARAAAYRHNRRMRGNLPRYMLKWTVGSFLTFLSVCGFDALASPGDGKVDVFVLMAAGCGILFAYAICVMVVTASAYLYLSHHER